MQSREDILMMLLNFSESIDVLSDKISAFSWDSDEDIVILTSSMVKKVLFRFLDGKLTGKDIEDWANLIECREDIGFEQGLENIISEIIYQLANPVLEGVIDIDSCKQKIALLDKVKA